MYPFSPKLLSHPGCHNMEQSSLCSTVRTWPFCPLEWKKGKCWVISKVSCWPALPNPIDPSLWPLCPMAGHLSQQSQGGPTWAGLGSHCWHLTTFWLRKHRSQLSGHGSCLPATSGSFFPEGFENRNSKGDQVVWVGRCNLQGEQCEVPISSRQIAGHLHTELLLPRCWALLISEPMTMDLPPRPLLHHAYYWRRLKSPVRTSTQQQVNKFLQLKLNLLIRLPFNPPTIFLFPTHPTHSILQLVKEDWNL